MESKRGQTEYAWIFSLIIGAVIIFLAIYSSSKYIQTSTLQSDIVIARQFDILLNPFASIGSITTMTLSKQVTMPTEMIINFTCNSDGGYEQMLLKTKTQKSFSEGVGYKISNKYIFAENLRGKNYWIFAKPLDIPWRVDDMIYIVSDSYCFVDPPESVRSEISDLGNEKVSLKCGAGSRKVCFGISRCDINVDYVHGIIRKNGERLQFYGDSLMYAAVFSDNALYKCTLDRIMSRLSMQSDINLKEAEKLGGEGCDTRKIQSDLISLKAAADKGAIADIGGLSNAVKSDNPSQCPIF